MKELNNIRKTLLRNSLVTYSCVVIAIVAMVLSFLTMQKGIDESRRYLYVMQYDGQVVPVTLADRRQNIAIEIKHHLQMFVENFYTLNQENWEAHVEKALWLGEFEQLHNKRINEGHYNRLAYGYRLTGELQPELIELSYDSRGNISFNIIINLTEVSGNKSNLYSIYAHGVVKIVERNFPHNPHGISIVEYAEDRVVKEE